MINIEVAFATPEKQQIITLSVDENISISEIVQRSKLAELFPEYKFDELSVGVFGKRIYDVDNYKINPNDRIEIYRPLNKTPNQKRLERAKNQ